MTVSGWLVAADVVRHGLHRFLKIEVRTNDFPPAHKALLPNSLTFFLIRNGVSAYNLWISSLHTRRAASFCLLTVAKTQAPGSLRQIFKLKDPLMKIGNTYSRSEPLFSESKIAQFESALRSGVSLIS
ncbi:hypothetical protein TNCV_3066531 [Trichonephila clavipes]|nr:hypothetical protein TNCV_3066531 [Trichonephila clavipes]